MVRDYTVYIGVKLDTKGALAELKKMQTEINKVTANISSGLNKELETTRQRFVGLDSIIATKLVGSIARMSSGFLTAADNARVFGERIRALSQDASQAAETVARLQRFGVTGGIRTNTLSNAFANFGFARGTGLRASDRQLSQAVGSIAYGARLEQAGTQDTNIAVREISHALTENRLDNRIINSLRLHLPGTFNIITRNIGQTNAGITVTVDNLRALARQGQITSDVLLRGLVNSFDELKRRAESTTPTLTTAFSNLGTAISNSGVGRFFGRITGGIARGAQSIAEDIASGSSSRAGALAAYKNLGVSPPSTLQSTPISNVTSAGISNTNTIPVALKTQFDALDSTIKNVGTSLDNNIVSTLANATRHAESLGDAISNIGRGIVDSASNAVTDVTARALFASLVQSFGNSPGNAFSTGAQDTLKYLGLGKRQ